MKFSGLVYLVKGYCCANFRNQQSFLTRNRDFRKSLYFYIVDAGKKTTTKKNKKKAASGCWHYSKSRANRKWTLEKKYRLQALASALIFRVRRFCCQ